MSAKKRQNPLPSGESRGQRWPGMIDVLVLGLPVLSLTPNNFVPPSFSYLGMATQELVVAVYLLVTLGLVVGVAWRRRQEPYPLDRLKIWIFGSLLAFLGWQIVTLWWAPAIADGLRLIGLWFLFAVFLGLSVTGAHARTGVWLYRLMTVLGIALAGTILYERYVYGIDLLGFFFNHGMASELLVALLPVQLMVLFQKERSGDLWLSFFAILVSLGSFLANLRRGVLLALAVVLVLITIGHLSRVVRLRYASRLAILYGLLLLGAVAVGIGAREYVLQRIEGAIDLTSAEAGASTRLRNWRTAVEMIKEKPLQGVGQGGFPNLYGFYRAGWISEPENAALAAAFGAEDSDSIRPPLTHNEFLEILTELGVVGLLLFLLVWGGITYSLWQRFRGAGGYFSLGALLGLVAFGISSLTSSFSFRYSPGMIWAWAVVVIGWVATPLLPGIDTDGSEPAQDGRWAIPGWGRLAIPILLIIPAGLLANWAWNVYQGQQLQGQATMTTEPLDLAFYPNNSAGNEGLARRYQQVLAHDPQNSGAHLGYALLLYQLKRNREALSHAEFALERGYSRPFAFVLVAFLKEQLTDLPGAIQTLERCVVAYPRSFFVRASLVEMLRLSGQEVAMRAHQEAMYSLDRSQMESWELSLRSSWKTAGEEATRRNLTPMRNLEPRLAGTLVSMRAYHYRP
ncbi:MAG: O-antigen ligase family protein [Blastocatellia bacterium]